MADGRLLGQESIVTANTAKFSTKLVTPIFHLDPVEKVRPTCHHDMYLPHPSTLLISLVLTKGHMISRGIPGAIDFWLVSNNQ
jgi:hypothetical protein